MYTECEYITTSINFSSIDIQCQLGRKNKYNWIHSHPQWLKIIKIDYLLDFRSFCSLKK